MKNFGKNQLSQVEMLKILGGDNFRCMRKMRNSDGSFTVFTFETQSYAVAQAWLGFWDSAGWDVICSVERDLKDQYV